MKQETPSPPRPTSRDAAGIRRRPAPTAALDRVESGVAIALTATAVVLHLRVLFYCGALWRDEVNGVNLARMPWAEFWPLSQFDSGFLAWFIVLRSWIAAFGDGDFALRGLGCLIGLSTIAAVWWTVRVLEVRVPLVALGLFVLQPTVILWGDTLRAYSLGTLMVPLMVGTLWRAMERPTPLRVATALVTALVGVHCVFYNSIVLFALGMGACARVWFTRRPRQALVALGIGFVSALSLLVYLGTIREIQGWSDVAKTWPDWSELGFRFLTAVTAGGELSGLAWALVVTLGLINNLYFGFRLGEHTDRETEGKALFLLVTLLVTIAGYAVFLRWQGYPPFAWHFLSLLALSGVVLEVLISIDTDYFAQARRVRLALVVLVGITIVWEAWPRTILRRTNLDAVCQYLQRHAGEDDFIVVPQWQHGITFRRYYLGKTPWTTLPSMSDLRVNRFDHLRELIQRADVNAEPLARVGRTLDAGRRVWVVGDIPLPPPGAKFEPLPPPPLPTTGWQGVPYMYSYAVELGTLLSARRCLPKVAAAPLGELCTDLEFDRVLVFEEGRR